MQTLTLLQPDDWHLHVREGAAMAAVVPHSAAQFARALIMPNLKPPITNTEAALAYQAQIRAACLPGQHFEPWMSLYLTDLTDSAEIMKAHQSGSILAAKLYPAGATTNAQAGVTKIEHIYDALYAMQDCGMVLCIHGEVTDPAVDIFDREKTFIDDVLVPLILRFPELKIVLEHITTAEAAQFVKLSSKNIAATITPQHLRLNRNALLVGGIQPHHYCLPILKREKHRQALLEVASSGSEKFFLGTDSAPHAQSTKQSACGCAGCYTAYHALALYAEAFESVQALDKLEGFASRHGATFYGLPLNTKQITLEKVPSPVPSQFDYLPEDPLIPLCAGETLSWRVRAVCE